QVYVNFRKNEYRRLVSEIGAANTGQRQAKAQFDTLLMEAILKEKVSAEGRLQRLKLMQKQLKERKGAPRHISAVEIEKALKEKPDYQSLTTKLAAMQKDLPERVLMYKDPNHASLLEMRAEIMRLIKDRGELRKKLIPEVKQEIKEYQ